MYMVMFKSAEGKDANHWTDSLDEAIKFVERLRNSEGLSDVKVFEMREIPLEVKAYYKVELAGSNAPSDEAPAEPEPAAVEA